MKKPVFVCLLLIALLFLSGCVLIDFLKTGNLTINYTTKQNASECASSYECQEGFHCMGDECVNNSLLDSFQSCVSNKCTETCAYCEHGKYVCMHSSEQFKENKCVACFTDFDCNKGYICKRYTCTAK